MRWRTLIVLVLAMALLMVFGAGAALAGEVKGPPEFGVGATGGETPIGAHPTPGVPGPANSECAFSGLNDTWTDTGDFPEPTLTQSYGTFLVLYGPEVMGKGTPGVACRGFPSLP